MEATLNSDKIELHTDGSAWVACIQNSPKPDKTFCIGDKECRVYHPDAREVATGNYGSDSSYKCPHCNAAWWVERDG